MAYSTPPKLKVTMTELVLGKVPNLKPARNREKAENLLKLCAELELFGPRQISAAELTKKLGNQKKPLGSWLRIGLTRYGSYNVSAGQSFSYRPNKTFCSNLRGMLAAPPVPIIEVAKKADKLFTPAPRTIWHRKGHRYYPWWTNMESEKRIELFLTQYDEMYDYDIEVARPTVFLQLYEKCLDDWQLRLMDKGFGEKYQVQTWRAMVENKCAFRNQLAFDLGLDYKTVKRVLQSITNGGYISTGSGNTTCKELGPITAWEFMQHPLYKGLRKDFVTMRDQMFKGVPKREIPKQLYAIYEKFEDAIMTLVDRELKSQGEKNLWYVHDGFFSNRKQDVSKLEALIKEKLHIDIKFEESHYTEVEAGQHV